MQLSGLLSHLLPQHVDRCGGVGDADAPAFAPPRAAPRAVLLREPTIRERKHSLDAAHCLRPVGERVVQQSIEGF